MTIKNMTELRNHLIQSIEKLANGDISVDEASTTGKMCEGVVSSVKAQVQFAALLNREPIIEFMGDCVGAPMINKNRLKSEPVQKLEAKEGSQMNLDK